MNEIQSRINVLLNNINMSLHGAKCFKKFMFVFATLMACKKRRCKFGHIDCVIKGFDIEQRIKLWCVRRNCQTN